MKEREEIEMKRFMQMMIGITLLIGVSACTGFNQDAFGFSLDSDQEILAFQALSAVNMMDAQTPQTVSTSRISKLSDEQVTSIDVIEPYLELFEQLLTQSNGIAVTTETSDLVEYETKQVFTVTDLLGEQVTYTMYYTKTSNEDELDDDQDEDDEDDEQEYALQGILIYGDMTYSISGKHEIEEDEEKLEFKAQISETDYVTVTYKLEDEETKFAYRVYANGELDSESTIKVEIEDDEFKIELSYLSGEDLGEYEFKLEEEDGETILKIEYQSILNGIESEGEAKVKVVYDEITGEAYYTIIVKGIDDDDEHEEHHDRDMDTDDDEDDDDDDEDDDEDSEDNEETDED